MEKRCKIVKSKAELMKLDPESTDIMSNGLLDYYNVVRWTRYRPVSGGSVPSDPSGLVRVVVDHGLQALLVPVQTDGHLTGASSGTPWAEAYRPPPSKGKCKGKNLLFEWWLWRRRRRRSGTTKG